MDIKDCAIWIFLWRKTDEHPSSDEKVLYCARVYAEAMGVESGRIGNQPTTGDEGLPYSAICRGERGKPYFPSLPDLHFSLSHSGDIVACAFHGQPVGLDLQIYTECRREAIARRYFHPEEYAFLERTGFKDFFPIWATKESYVKYTGAGIAGGLDTFCVVEGDGLKDKMDSEAGDMVGHALGPVEFRRRELPEGYSLCLCAASIPGVYTVDFRQKDYLPNG
jgi:4'-phosphopantetheinyl transferase